MGGLLRHLTVAARALVAENGAARNVGTLGGDETMTIAVSPGGPVTAMPAPELPGARQPVLC